MRTSPNMKSGRCTYCKKKTRNCGCRWKGGTKRRCHNYATIVPKLKLPEKPLDLFPELK